MAKSRAISGFPEWLPEGKLLEEEIVHSIRSIYEGYGFVPIETPAVELLDTLTSKGVVDKELYALKRLKAEEGEESDLGLHFDLTVPFARYVAQHAQNLVFPFKRYQLQKVWRGERPQKGRFREFYQFDIDIVARDNLPLSADAEALSALAEAVSVVGLGDFVLKINNRKILLGYFESLGLEGDTLSFAIRTIDKVDKIGVEGVTKELEGYGLASDVAVRTVALCTYSFSLDDVQLQADTLAVDNPLFAEGVSELVTLGKLLSPQVKEKIEVTLSLARGLDYYTGLIVETFVKDHPEFGSIASGGRYDGLVSQFSSMNIPGVGFSIGLTRLMDLIQTHNLRSLEKKSNALVVVAVYNEEQRPQCNEIARELRAHGVATEVFLKSPKLGKQIDYAAKKGVPYVLFLSEEGQLELKDIRSGEQETCVSLEVVTHKVL